MKHDKTRVATIDAIEAAIKVVDEQAESILESCTIGADRNPSTMDDDARAEYERLCMIAINARCSVTILSRKIKIYRPVPRRTSRA